MDAEKVAKKKSHKSQSMLAHARSVFETTVEIGIISRLDWPDRVSKGLLETGYNVFEGENAEFAVLSGGVVSERDFYTRLQAEVEQALARQDALRREEVARNVPKKDRAPKETKTELRHRLKAELIERGVQELAEFIPRRTKKDGSPFKTYIVTSPAPSYDGKIGTQIARRLHVLRDDIIFWNEEDGRVPIKFPDRPTDPREDIFFVHVQKSVWRNKNISSNPDRIVEDKESQMQQPDLPGFWVSGCAGVGYLRPAGEFHRARISPPALHRLARVQSSENQIGVHVIRTVPIVDDGEEAEADKDAKKARPAEPELVDYNFNDLVTFDRLTLEAPAGANDRQRAILREIKTQPSTIGMLSHNLTWPEEAIEQELTDYMAAGMVPPVILEETGKYRIDQQYLRRDVRYEFPPDSKLKEDRFYAFGCLHAGYRWTQYDYFVNEVPRLILAHDVHILVGCGDYHAGLKHNLDRRRRRKNIRVEKREEESRTYVREVIYGLNNSEQAYLSATMVRTVMLKVFYERFTQLLKERSWNDSMTSKRVAKLVDVALLEFRFELGNHDDWDSDTGHTPLEEFATVLETTLHQSIDGFLRKKKLPVELNLWEIVKRHVIYATRHRLPSGLQFAIRHPYMARTLASSGRAQGTMAYERDDNLIFVANFHTAAYVPHYLNTIGQQVAIQVGTLAAKTDFEESKNKRCDVGGALVKVYSQDGRVKKCSIVFKGPAESEFVEFDDKTLAYNEFVARLSAWPGA